MPETVSPAATHRQVPAVTRAIRILRLLGENNKAWGGRELAKELDLVPSTCLHILRVLVAEGLVQFDAGSKRYSLGVGILGLARLAIQQSDFATIARPMLTRLSDQFGVTAMATQLIPDRQMIVLAISQARQPFRLAADLGSRFPELSSATGRCVAAFNGFNRATLRARFGHLTWDNSPDFSSWLAEIERTRADGYGVDRANFLNGLTIIAVPVFDDDGRMSKGLVSLGISETVDAIGVDNIAGEMLEMRDEVTRYLLA